VNPIEEGARAAARPSGGITLIDLFVAIAGSWALPLAARALGLGLVWIGLLHVANAFAGLVWAFHSRKLGWYLFVRGKEIEQVRPAVLHAGVLFILLLTVAMQYVVYLIVLNVMRQVM